MIRHQAMVLVGNGFDISVLRKYGEGVTTSYPTFYSYFKYKYPEREDNSLILQMERAREDGKENWSDFEAQLADKLNTIESRDMDNVTKLNQDLHEIQKAFSRFLNEVVDSNIIERLSNVTEQVPIDKKSLALYSISSFLGDLSEEQYNMNKFQNSVDNNELLNFIFINFNYTSLLDNYIYLNKEVFEPSPYITSKNNFIFYTNPKSYSGHRGFKNPYCRLTTSIHHPHGYQDIPKSLLFGTEVINNDENFVPAKDLRRNFIKSYWAQSESKYGEFFKESNLFIIYGCSLGESDNWWWKNIYTRLISSEAELIIYNFGNENENVIKDRFIKGCCIDRSHTDMIDIAIANIFVINFGPQTMNEIVFLQLPKNIE